MRKRSHAEKCKRVEIDVTPKDFARMMAMCDCIGIKSFAIGVSYLIRRFAAPQHVDVTIQIPFVTMAHANEMCDELAIYGGARSWIEKSVTDSIDASYKEFLLSKKIDPETEKEIKLR